MLPRSGDPFYILRYYMKRVTTPWTYSSLFSLTQIHIKLAQYLYEERGQVVYKTAPFQLNPTDILSPCKAIYCRESMPVLKQQKS